MIHNYLYNRVAEGIDNIHAKRDATKPNWVDKELRKVLWLVNHERNQLGKPPITLNTLMEAEAQALGHVDYARKLTLYCVELILDKPPLL